MERFVAFLDILGFKNMVEQRTLEALEEVMGTFKAAIDLSNNIHVPGAPTPSCTISLIHFVTFSDSIVLYSDGIESHDFFRIVHVVKSLISCSLMYKTPLRGSVAHGEFFADKENGMFFGKALISAYENEGKQQWAGAYICDNTIDFVKTLFPDTLSKLQKLAYLVEYEIPFKKYIDKATSELVQYTSKYNITINWANMTPELSQRLSVAMKTGYPFLSYDLDGAVDEFDNLQLSEKDKQDLVFMLDRSKVDTDILSKWDNTKKFYDYANDIGKTPLRFARKLEVLTE